MATKTPTLTASAILADLKAGKYAPVYLLMGEESYYIDVISDFIAENALREEERDFNQTIVFGSDVTAAQIADAARSYPVMAERRVVIVKEAQNVKDWEPMEKYLAKPAKTTVLVVCYKNGTMDARKKATQAFKSAGVVYESKKLRDRELPVFITDYLKQRTKATIDAKAVQMIADHVGADLSRVVGELDKLLLSLRPGETGITPLVVEQRIGISKDYNVFEMKNAVAAKDAVKAYRILEYFDANPKSGGPFVLVPFLFSYFQNLMISYYAPVQSDRGIAEWLGLRNEWAAREYVQGKRNYTAQKTMRIIEKIRETDAKMKGLDNPSTSPFELVQELVFFIMH